MSFKAIQSVLENSETSGNSRLVLIAIASHFGKNKSSWPSIDRIAELTNCNQRTVKRAIKECTENGELIVKKQAGQSGVNVYSLSYYGGDKRDKGVTNRAKNMSQMSPQAGQTRQQNGQTRHENGQIVQKDVANVTQTYKNLKESKEPIYDGAHPSTTHLSPMEKILFFISRGENPKRDTVLWNVIKRFGRDKLRNMSDHDATFQVKTIERMYNEELKRLS